MLRRCFIRTASIRLLYRNIKHHSPCISFVPSVFEKHHLKFFTTESITKLKERKQNILPLDIQLSAIEESIRKFEERDRESKTRTKDAEQLMEEALERFNNTINDRYEGFIEEPITREKIFPIVERLIACNAELSRTSVGLSNMRSIYSSLKKLDAEGDLKLDLDFYHLILDGFADHKGQSDHGIIMADMMAKDIQITPRTFRSLIRCALRRYDYETSTKLLAYMLKKKMVPDEETRKLFDEYHPITEHKD